MRFPDHPAVDLLFRTALRLALKQGRGMGLTDDDIAEGVLKFCTALFQGQVRRDPLAYLLTCLRNARMDRFRANGRHVKAFSDRRLDCWADDRSAAACEARELVATALGLLTDQERHAIHLRFMHDAGFKPIGQTLGTSTSSAYRDIGRALNKLREHWHVNKP